MDDQMIIGLLKRGMNFRKAIKITTLSNENKTHRLISCLE